MRIAVKAALILALFAAPWTRPARAALPAAQVPAVQPSPLPNDPLQTTIHRLANGLTIYLSPNHQRPRITAWIVVRTGSKNDPAKTTGLAHYLEHMLFKGTPQLGTLDYAKERPHLERITRLYEEHFRAKDPALRRKLYAEIDQENQKAARYEVPNELDKVYREMGFQGLNAFTSNEQTVFVVNLPANRLDAWATLEAARFSHPVFRLFQSELETVYEEKNRTLDNADRMLDQAVNRALYPEHPYGTQTTIGTIANLKNPSLRRMYEYFGRWYRPNNMALVLSGDFEPEPTLRLLAKRFGGWKPAGLPAPRTGPLPPPRGTKRVELKYDAEEKVVIAWPTASYLSPDRDALTVMDMLMDNSVAGLLNLELDQAQKVKAAGSSPTFYNDAGDWRVWAVPKAGQSLEQAEVLLLRTVDHLKQGRFTEDDIKAVITSFEVAQKERLESNDARAEFMAESFVRREAWPHAVQELDRLRRVTKADVLRVAAKYLGPDRVIVYRRRGQAVIPHISKPGFTTVPIDSSRQSAFARRILALPAPPIQPHWLLEGRDYEQAELPSGTFFTARNPFDDLFSLTWVFEEGRRQQPDLCAALDLLELSGAGLLSADAFKKKLFSLGTSLSYSCGDQESSVTLTGLDRNFWESLQLMRRRFESPNVDAGTLHKMVDVAIGAHRDAKSDPGTVFGALGEWARRGADSPVLRELSDDQLRRLDLKTLESLLAKLPRTAHRTAYVGDRPIGEVAQLLAQEGRYAPAPPRIPERLLRPDGPRVVFTPRKMVQARVGLFVDDGPDDPSRIVDEMFLSGYLGGGMSSVIFQEIREARSLAYAAWGGYAPAEHKADDGQLYAGLGCQADKTPDAAALLRQLTLDPPWSEARFKETADAIEANYRSDPLTFREIPAALIDWQDEGLPPGDPRPQRFKRAQGYTLTQLEAFAARFKNAPSTLYVLGDPSRVGLSRLKTLGRFEQRSIDQLFPY